MSFACFCYRIMGSGNRQYIRMCVCVCVVFKLQKGKQKQKKTFFWYELIMSTNGRLLSFLHQVKNFNAHTPHVLVVEADTCVCEYGASINYCLLNKRRDKNV